MKERERKIKEGKKKGTKGKEKDELKRTLHTHINGGTKPVLRVPQEVGEKSCW